MLGGAIVAPPTDIPTVGRFAVLKDQHQLTLAGGPVATELALPMLQIVFLNLTGWLFGTRYGVSTQHSSRT